MFKVSIFFKIIIGSSKKNNNLKREAVHVTGRARKA
jgi:hypothetical protein